MYEKDGIKHPETLVEALQLDGAPVPTADEVRDQIAYHTAVLEYCQALLTELEAGDAS